MNEAEIGPSKAPAGPERQDAQISRLAALWIWSVFFGVNGGLSYSFLTPHGGLSGLGMFDVAFLGNRFNPGMPGAAPQLMMLVSPFATAIGVLASVAGWVYLYMYFTGFVLPVVFLGTALPNEDRRRRRAALLLSRSYQLLILAGLARFVPELLLMLVPALSRFGVL